MRLFTCAIAGGLIAFSALVFSSARASDPKLSALGRTTPAAVAIARMASPELPTPNTRKAKVTGGKDAQPGQFKSQVALILSAAPKDDPYSGLFCGATLIDWRWVLTAAHCTFTSKSGDDTSLRGMAASEVDVYLGSHDFTGGERIGVAKIIRHKDYNAISQDNDLALLELAAEPSRKSGLEQVRLPEARHQSSFQRGTQATVVGWGSTERGKVPTELRSTVSRLQYFDSIQFKDVNACNRYHILEARKDVAKVLQARGAAPSKIRASLDRWYPLDAQMISENMLCAGSHDGAGDACFGDSGGPLLVRAREGLIQVGVVSWGPSGGCGLTNSFGVYVKLSRFTDWIGSNTGLSVGK